VVAVAAMRAKINPFFIEGASFAGADLRWSPTTFVTEQGSQAATCIQVTVLFRRFRK
jgi:hypothetical protein